MAERTPLRAHPVPSVLGLRGGFDDDNDIAILRKVDVKDIFSVVDASLAPRRTDTGCRFQGYKTKG